MQKNTSTNLKINVFNCIFKSFTFRLLMIFWLFFIILNPLHFFTYNKKNITISQPSIFMSGKGLWYFYDTKTNDKYYVKCKHTIDKYKNMDFCKIYQTEQLEIMEIKAIFFENTLSFRRDIVFLQEVQYRNKYHVINFTFSSDSLKDSEKSFENERYFWMTLLILSYVCLFVYIFLKYRYKKKYFLRYFYDR